MKIPVIIPMKGRGLINQGSTLNPKPRVIVTPRKLQDSAPKLCWHASMHLLLFSFSCFPGGGGGCQEGCSHPKWFA